MIAWLRTRRIARLKIRLASKEAELELLGRIHCPGKPNVIRGEQLERMTELIASIAGIKEELRLRGEQT